MFKDCFYSQPLFFIKEMLSAVLASIEIHFTTTSHIKTKLYRNVKYCKI